MPSQYGYCVSYQKFKSVSFTPNCISAYLPLNEDKSVKGVKQSVLVFHIGIGLVPTKKIHFKFWSQSVMHFIVNTRFVRVNCFSEQEEKNIEVGYTVMEIYN